MSRIALYWLSLAKGEKKGIKDKIIKFLLWIGSCIYGLGISLRLYFYRRNIFKKRMLPRKVISVGNITLGGSGKTPLVEFLGHLCQSKGIRPGILIRGYGLEKGICDEAQIFQINIPEAMIIVGRDRFAKATEALEKEKIDAFIMDDGFQHLRLHRDLDIVVIDSTAPFGYDFLIPRGFLREPLSSLRRADVFVLTKVDFARERVGWITSRLRDLNPSAFVVESIHEPVSLLDMKQASKEVPLSFLAEKEICACSAIGSPETFYQVLTSLGARIKKDFSFRDHHFFTHQDVQAIVRYCRTNGISVIVVTQKDAVKLRTLEHFLDNDLTILTLMIKIQITKGRKEFEERIFHLLER